MTFSAKWWDGISDDTSISLPSKNYPVSRHFRRRPEGVYKRIIEGEFSEFLGPAGDHIRAPTDVRARENFPRAFFVRLNIVSHHPNAWNLAQTESGRVVTKSCSENFTTGLEY